MIFSCWFAMVSFIFVVFCVIQGVVGVEVNVVDGGGCTGSCVGEPKWSCCEEVEDSAE